MRYLLLIFLLAAGCNNMLYGGGGPPPKPEHFLLTLENDDAVVETISVCWWNGSGIVGSRDVPLKPGEVGRLDLGTVRPDGFQAVATAWNGLLQGPGGLVFQDPEYDWTPKLIYPYKDLRSR